MITTPTVKSCPYKKVIRVRTGKKRHLWTNTQTTELGKRSWEDYKAGFKPKKGEYPISPACLAMIVEFNKQLDC